jgi:F-type H+-transporting ATPase subunit delta
MKGNLVSAKVIEPYAQALMSVAQSHNLSERFGDDIRSLMDLMATSQELREFVGNPIVKSANKKAVLQQIAGEGTHPYLLNFLMLLVDKRRIIFIEEICQQYLVLLRKLNNIVLAEVTSASELSEAQKQSVTEKVKALTQAQTVEIKTLVDPSLIGGVIVKVGSQVLDASIKGQLRRIRLSLNSAA